ncbi:uncharacterized protein BROUX77_004712 [Berkeleyomyces rouxiae]|uniref:uncharacterized protein n=1 Tax=Berkeleyomyces rouxiae TaxID=2035830 RepID=UPI003B7E4485
MDPPKVTHVGRGGAGNLQSHDFVNHLPESEQASVNLARKKDASPYVSGGRGGAGNFAAPSAVAESVAEQQAVVDAIQARTSTLSQRASGWSGRGGAGNWNAEAAREANRQAEAARKETMAAIDAKVEQIVDVDLPAPPPTYPGP